MHKNWYYPVLDSEGSTVCYEYMSIKLQNPEMQQWGCRGEFPGSEFRRVSPTPSGDQEERGEHGGGVVRP